MAQVLPPGNASPPTSNVDPHALRELHGRKFNVVNNMYTLPADAPEHARLGLQHEALFLALRESLYQAREDVRAALATHPGKARPAIIDIGTGSGIWAIEMAKEFPECDVLGVDLAPVGVANTSDVPANCRFEVRDANKGFPEYHGAFDVVHARCTGSGIKDRESFCREVKAMLRPGGVFLFVDGDLHLYSEALEQLPWREEGEAGFSWLLKVFQFTFQTFEARGFMIGRTPDDAAVHMKLVGGFEGIATESVHVPIGAWLKGDPQGESRIKRMGEAMGKDALQVLQGHRPAIVEGGVPQETVDEAIRRAELEVQNDPAHIYSAWHYSWAVKSRE
ncbi:S-adenosyl-L-methionine-dependent methyltransferase [Auricularia subglabra TFB-10046 SS5]|nr:S-adenosyl-L-methionine-dependent methyltransferase [Auricularia subglabra TFB-10046 SS5]